MNKVILTLCISLITITLLAQEIESFPINDSERTNWDFLLNQKADWYNSAEALRIADNMLLLQRRWGGWPKNINAARHFNAEEIKEIEHEKNKIDATIDNGTTYTHLRYLAIITKATSDVKYHDAFLKGLDYLFEAQYNNGGWPQFFPLTEGYYTHITYNDDAMTGVLYLLKDIVDGNPDFSFLNKERVQKAKTALQKGIDVTLKAQIKINGKLTGWCAQHDEVTLAPADARSYELASISGKETVGIVEFLMSIDHPSTAIQQSIIGACKWFAEVKITGMNLKYLSDSTQRHDFNRVMVEDKNGPDLWARFYDIETGKPLWVDRGGIICKNYNDISGERRNGYAFVEQFAHQLLTTEFPEWKRKNNLK